MILTALAGSDGISQNFRFHLTVQSQDDTFNGNDPSQNWQSLRGQSVTFSIEQDNSSALFNGIVYAVAQEDQGYDSGYCRYVLTVIPWFECLQQVQNCRVFHNQTVLQIFTQVCQELQFYDFDLSQVKNTYQPLLRCVQFNERSVDFLRRILAEAGIFYYFNHSDGKHVMMLCDRQSLLPDIGPIGFRDSQIAEHITVWNAKRRATANAVTFNAYQFTTPNDSLLSNTNNPNAPAPVGKSLCDYRYQDYVDQNNGSVLANREAAIQTWQASLIKGQSNVLPFSPAVMFEVNNAQYLLVSIEHSAFDRSHFHSKEANTPAREYHNHFTAIPSSVTFYPETPQNPALKNFSTAYHHGIVTTANKQELNTESYGQVKVSMLWERNPTTAEKVAQYARVTQPYAGNGHGLQFIPRAGQEVLVSHMNGDFSQPVVLASLYNSNNPPFASLPAQQNLSGFKTHSLNTNDPNSGNLLVWDDTPGSEIFAIHAQKDLNMDVLNNSVHSVNGGEEVYIQGDQLMQLLKGTANITAKEIHLIVEGCMLIIDDNGINAKVASGSGGSGQVQILAKGAGATLPVARMGDYHKCPKLVGSQPHHGGPVLQGASPVLANGLPIARVNDPAHCRSGTDTISTGVNSVIINGQPVSRLNDQTKHGGVIQAASPNVVVGETPGVAPILPPPGPLLCEAPAANGPHWIQGQYLNTDGTPMTGMPYTISHSDGTTVTGTLDANGQTQKVTGLNPGASTISFGDRPKLLSDLAAERQKLQQALNNILAAAKVQAEKDQETLNSEGWFMRAATYVGTAVEGFVTPIGHALSDIAQEQAIQSQAQSASLSGNSEQLAQADQQMVDLGNQMYGPLFQGVKLMKQLNEDPDTRSMLWQFAENYYHTASGLMIDKQVATIAGGFIPAIIIAVLTASPEAFPADLLGEAAADFAEVSETAQAEATTLDALADTTEIKGANVDNTHVVQKPSTTDYWAEGEKQPLNYDISNWKDYGLPPDGRFSRTLRADDAKALKDGDSINFGGRPIDGYSSGAGFIGSASEQSDLVTAAQYKDAMQLNYEPDFILEFQLRETSKLQNLLQFDDPLFVPGGKTGAGYSEYNFPGITSDDIINWRLRPLKAL
jgi:type VI secretion system secreted protein VgrG